MFSRQPIMKFMCHPNLSGLMPEPKPAAKFLPDWFKKIPPYLDERDQFGAKSMTAKKCVPMIDAMSLGYVIPLTGDLHVISNNDNSIVRVMNPPELKVCEYHSIDQVGGKTAPGFPAPPLKFINHWIIKTAPGWSTLILPLINDFEETRFTCLSGLVDTDRYPKEINFPAVWNAKNFDDTIAAGTPLVVAIPIKRSSVSRQPVIKTMTPGEVKKVEDIQRQQGMRHHVYTEELREPRK